MVIVSRVQVDLHKVAFAEKITAIYRHSPKIIALFYSSEWWMDKLALLRSEDACKDVHLDILARRRMSVHVCVWGEVQSNGFYIFVYELLLLQVLSIVVHNVKMNMFVDWVWVKVFLELVNLGLNILRKSLMDLLELRVGRGVTLERGSRVNPLVVVT